MAKRCPFRKRIDRSIVVGVALSLLCVAGCGGIRLYPVEGTVTLDDQPVSDAGVMFHPQAGGPVGEAVTDANGRFVIHCMNKPGIPAGDYNITVVKQKAIGQIESPDGLSAGVTGSGLKIEWLLPEKYSKFDDSILKTKVPGGDYALKLSKK